MTQSKLTNFVFTLNNPTITPSELWSNLQSIARYLVFQEEKGENGTTHFQGYCELHRRTRFPTVKNCIPNAHIEPRRGTQAQAKDYSTKEDTRTSGPFEFGEYIEASPGKRNDLTGFRDAIREGKRKRELDDEFPGLLSRYPRYVDTVRSYGTQQLRLDLSVELYYGPPGTGKTRKAWEDNEDDLYFIPVSDNLWFDGYDGQRTLLMDDFTGWMKLDHLLRLLDIYPVQIPVKGGFTWLQATKIILTSNKPISEWYDWNKHGSVKYRALRRRFHKILEFTNNNSWQDVSDAEEPAVDIIDFGLGN